MTTDNHPLTALVERMRSPAFVVPETLVGKGVELACVELEAVIKKMSEDRCDVAQMPCKSDDVAFKPCCSTHLIRVDGNALYWGKFS